MNYSCWSRTISFPHVKSLEMRSQLKHRFISSLISDTINRFSSYRISEERSIITTLPLRQLLCLSKLLRQLARSSMTPRVLATQVKRHEDAEHKTHRLEANQDGVTRGKSRCISRPIDISSNHTSNVSKSDMHRHTHATLGRSANVVSVPSNTLGYVRVYAACDEEDADVLDGVILAADEHDEADEPANLLAYALQS